MSQLYEDPRIQCDEEGITIRGYYFPLGTRKRIPYGKVEGFETFEIGTFTGRYRIWGTTNLRYWLNLDPDRPDKRTAVVLHVGSWVRPVVTPDDPTAFLAVLAARTGGAAAGAGSPSL